MNTQDLIAAVNKWPDGPNISPFEPYTDKFLYGERLTLAQYNHTQDTLECDINSHTWLFLHELTHAVGSRRRLDRYRPSYEQDSKYAHEEVIAAEAATELCLQLSLPLGTFGGFVEIYAPRWLDRAPPIRYNEVDESVDYILRRFRHALPAL